jgi:hypothetical protein
VPYLKVVLGAQRTPGAHFIFREYQDYFDVFIIAMKRQHRMHQDGQATNFEKLFGCGTLHSGAFTTGNDKGVFRIIHRFTKIPKL